MIETLLREGARYGEPEYSRESAVIIETARALSQQLDQGGKQLLAELEDAYQAREAAVLRSAFAGGFCSAVRLGLEVLEHPLPGGGG